MHWQKWLVSILVALKIMLLQQWVKLKVIHKEYSKLKNRQYKMQQQL